MGLVCGRYSRLCCLTEEVVPQTQRIRKLVKRSDLLVFVDNMLTLKNSNSELTQANQELENLKMMCNLSINMAKFQFIMNYSLSDIAGL
jgi:hypothetical protein